MVMLKKVLEVWQMNSLKMLHWLSPAVGAWEDQVPGTDFLSWIWWDRVLQIFHLHLGWQKSKVEETWPTCVKPEDCPRLTSFGGPTGPVGEILGRKRPMCWCPRMSRLAFLLSGRSGLAEREAEGQRVQAQQRVKADPSTGT